MEKVEKEETTVQGFGPPVPVQTVGGGAGPAGPSACDCGSPSAVNQAEGVTNATGNKKEVEQCKREKAEIKNTRDELSGYIPNRRETPDPFKRRSSIFRSPPQRERLQSCPDVPAFFRDEIQPKKLETAAHRIDKEEKLAFEGLGKHLAIIDGIVKDARNIHKQIRDATVAAVIFYQRLKDIREAREKDKEAAKNAGDALNNQKIPAQTKSQTTQTEESTGDLSGALSGKQRQAQKSQAVQTETTGIQSNPGDGGQNTTIVENENKKRVASSSPDISKQGKRVRTAQRRVEKTPTKIEKSAEGNETAEDWQIVDHRKKKRKKEDNQTEEQTNEKSVNREDGPKKSQARRKRSEAVAVKITDGTTYANVLKELKTKVDPQKMGLQVSGIRKTRAGEILIEIKNGSGKTEDLRTTVAAALGQGVSVRTLGQAVSLIVRDLDGAMEKTEVAEAIKAAVEEHYRDSIKVKTLRKAFGETQVAVVSLPSRAAEEVLKKGRLRIGWVMCRVREKVDVVRCFRCLGFGHMARDCKGNDRTNACFLCGEAGHIAKSCKRDPLCVICKENEEPGGSNHINGSARCESFRREIEKARK